MSSRLKKQLIKEIELKKEKTKDFPFDLAIKILNSGMGESVFDGEDAEILDCVVAYYDAKDISDKAAMEKERGGLARILERVL